MTAKYWARSSKNGGTHHQDLSVHLRNTAQLTEWLLSTVGLGNTGYLAGLLHDIGKTRPGFVQKLMGTYPPTTDSNHSGVSGLWLFNYIREFSKDNKNDIRFIYILSEFLAHAVCGHHRGMYDSISLLDEHPGLNNIVCSQNTTIDIDVPYIKDFLSGEQINKKIKNAIEEIRAIAVKVAGDVSVIRSFNLGQYCRMIHTALCLSDRTDAALFDEGKDFDQGFLEFKDSFGFDNGKAFSKDWKRLADCLEKRLKELSDAAKEKALSDRQEKMQFWRTEIADKCLDYSRKTKGIYFLEAPTGSGKTMASMRFALNHAKEHKMHKIIYFLPFLTLTEQTSDVFKRTFGEDNICEHYSGIRRDNTQDADEWGPRILRRLWKEPIVVSTLWRFFETFMSKDISDKSLLFAMQNSVIVCDEIQSIPIKLLGLFKFFINFLVNFMGCTVVFCTATNPFKALRQEEKKHIYIDFEPILDTSETQKIKSVFSFVKIKFHGLETTGSIPYLKEFSEVEIADFVYSTIIKKNINSFLVVTNTVEQAEIITRLLIERFQKNTVGKDCKIFYLSGALCSRHRKDMYMSMSENMKSKSGLTICVATKVVEAGVDISFKDGVRYLEGLDSIMQCGGRVNRYGEYGDESTLNIFRVGETEFDVLKPIWKAKHATNEIITMNAKNVKEEIIQPGVLLDLFFQRKFKKNTSDSSTEWTEYDYLFSSYYGDTSMVAVLGENKKKSTEANECKFCLCQDFEQAEKHFQVYETSGVSVIVPYNNESKDLIERLSQKLPVSYDVLAQYTVNVYPHKLKELESKGLVGKIDTVYGPMFVLSKYDPLFGVSKSLENNDLLIV